MNAFVEPLVRPVSGFDNWEPNHRLTVVLIVLVSVASVVSVRLASDAVGTAPTAAMTLQAALAPLAWILLVGTLSLVVSGEGGGSDWDALRVLAEGCGVGAIAAVPGLARAVVRPIAVRRALADGAGVQAVLAPGDIVWQAVVAITAVWSAAIVFGGVEAHEGTDRRFAAGVAVIAGGSIGASLVVHSGVDLAGSGLLGLVALVVGTGVVLTARTWVTIKREFQLIGYRGGRGVEGQGWFVGLYRLAGLAGIALGFVLLDGHLLA